LLCSFSINLDATVFTFGVIVFSSGLPDGYDLEVRLMAQPQEVTQRRKFFFLNKSQEKQF